MLRVLQNKLQPIVSHTLAPKGSQNALAAASLHSCGKAWRKNLGDEVVELKEEKPREGAENMHKEHYYYYDPLTSFVDTFLRPLRVQPERSNFWEPFIENLRPHQQHGHRAPWSPRVDISETDKEVIVTTELPGIKKEDVTITLKDGTLEIKGERRKEEKYEDKERKYNRIERRYGAFARRISVPDVRPEDIKAKFENGILNVHVPKKETEKDHSVRIE